MKRGCVCGDPLNDPPRLVGFFGPMIIVLKMAWKLQKGYTPQIHIHTASIPCKITEIK